jgi:long-chain acyl-CoA synthetase
MNAERLENLLDGRTLPAVLRLASSRYAGHPALSLFGEDSIGYAELPARMRFAAGLLAAVGVGPGDRVAILGENGPSWAIAYFAIASMGAVAVPILTDFSAGQVGTIVAHAGCRAVLVSERLREKLVAALQISRESRPAVIGLGDVARVAPTPSSPAMPIEFPAVLPDDLAAILYTSGTTGHSKGVMLTHGNIVSNAVATRTILAIRPGDRLLSILPLAHAYECTLGFVGALMQGASITYLDRPPTASALLPALASVRPTIMLTVPLVIEKIVRGKVLPELEHRAGYRLAPVRALLNLVAGAKLRRTFGGRLRFFGVGGAGLAPDVERFLSAARFPYAIGYGLTETSPLVAGCSPFRTRLGAVGPVLAGVEVRLAEAAPGGAGGAAAGGEIQVRGPNVMRGYYRDPDRTREAFTEDGWFRTGDLGTLDRRGRLAIRGRLKTMILGASGENIYPEEIEALINQVEPVAESLVYGGASGVTALVHLKPETLEHLGARVQDGLAKAEHAVAALLERIRRDVNSRLAAFSRVALVQLQTEPFEKTPTQKIKRHLYPRRRE